MDEWEDACVCDACLCKSFHITRKILFSLRLIITHSCHFNSLHFPSFLNHFSSLPLLRFPHIFFQAVAHRMQKINNINLGVVSLSLSLSLPLVLSLVCNFMNGSPRHNNKSEREIARERGNRGRTRRSAARFVFCIPDPHQRQKTAGNKRLWPIVYNKKQSTE